MLGTIFITSLVGALAGILGGLFLLWKENFARKVSVYFVAFATGTLLAAALLDLLPEALGRGSVRAVMFLALVGFIIFLILEKFLLWYHCHNGQCDIHNPPTYKYTVVIGDTLHNFIDGIAIAVSFLIDIRLGFATAIAVFAHEIPQEIGDVGVLLHAGLDRLKVVVFNVVSALAAPVGALVGFYLGSLIIPIESFVLAFVAGNFIYVAASDLIPHLQQEWNWKSSGLQVLLMFLGILIIGFVG